MKENRDMKVLMLTDIFPSIENPSSGIFIHELVRKLDRLCEVDIIHPKSWHPLSGNHDRVKLEKNREQNGLPRCNILRPKLFIPPRGDRLILRGMSFFVSMIPYLMKKRQESKYDLVHAHMAVPAGFSGVLAGKFLKTPLLITCHGSDIHTYPNYRYLKLMVSYALDSAQQVVFVSKALLKSAKERGFSFERATVIHNGVDKARFGPEEKSRCRRRLGLEVEPKVILFIGNLLPVKGVTLLLHAFADLIRIVSDIRLIIVGKGEQEGELKRQALGLGIANSVRFVGVVAHAEVPAWINACDVFCLPSINEGFPTVIPEVLSCGRPIVASRVGGIPEILTSSNQGILVPPGDDVMLSRALRVALESNWNVALISQSVNGYSWERIAAEYFRLYNTTIEDS